MTALQGRALARSDRGLPRPAAGAASARRWSPCTRATRRCCRRRSSPSRTGCEVYLKVEGANPTGSFKDRGMTMAITKAVEEGAKAVICASTGNTSASAAAYAARAGLTCAVLVPQGKIALGKLAQALVHGAQLLQVDGNFDDCLALARKLADRLPGQRWSTRVNPFRIEGQKTAAFEIVDVLGRRPRHPLPAGRQRRQHHRLLAGLPRVRGRRHRRRARRGCSASRPPAPRRSSPASVGRAARRPSRPPSGSATRRPGPRRSTPATSSGGRIDAVTDRADPRRLPAAGPQRGGLRRAGVGRLGRRPAAGRRGRRARAGPARGLHGHRQRAQGPGVGHLRRAGAGDGPGRRRGRGRAARPVTRPAPSASACPATSANLGPAFDCAGLALTRYDVLEFAVLPRRAWRSTVSGDRGGRAAHRRVAPGRARVPGGVRRSSAGHRPGCGWSPTTGFRRGGGWAPRPPPSSPASWAPGRCVPTSTGVDDGRRAAPDVAELEGHPDNVAPACSAGPTLSWT